MLAGGRGAKVRRTGGAEYVGARARANQAGRPGKQEGPMAWTQVYDPLHNWMLSTLVAALPIVVLFGTLAGLRWRPHWCAMAGAASAALVAVTIFRMPFALAGMSFLFG